MMRTIEGVLTLTTPLHVADNIKARVDDLGFVVPDIANGMPLTRTRRLRLVKPMADGGCENSPDEGAHRTAYMELPYFPSNDLRGRLRRFAASAILDHLIGRGETVPMSTYHGLTCGAVSGAPSGERTLSETARARTHLFMGVFGGGPKLYRSGFRTHDLTPIVPATIAARTVPSKYQDHQVDAASWRDINYFVHIIRKDDVLMLEDKRISKVIHNYMEDVAAWQDLNRDEGAAAKVARKKKQQGEDPGAKIKRERIRNMSAIEVVAVGVPLYLRIDFADHLSDAQIGLLIESIVVLANDQALGGWVSKGLGRFVLDLNYLEDGDDQGKALDFDGTHYMPADTPAISAMMDAYSEALSNITAADVDGFFNEEE